MTTLTILSVCRKTRKQTERIRKRVRERKLLLSASRITNELMLSLRRRLPAPKTTAVFREGKKEKKRMLF